MKVKQYSKTAKPKLHPTQEENRIVSAHPHINFYIWYIYITAYVSVNTVYKGMKHKLPENGRFRASAAPGLIEAFSCNWQRIIKGFAEGLQVLRLALGTQIQPRQKLG